MVFSTYAHDCAKKKIEVLTGSEEALRGVSTLLSPAPRGTRFRTESRQDDMRLAKARLRSSRLRHLTRVSHISSLSTFRCRFFTESWMTFRIEYLNMEGNAINVETGSHLLLNFPLLVLGSHYSRPLNVITQT